jgi:Flp pilus assembly protein TadG
MVIDRAVERRRRPLPSRHGRTAVETAIVLSIVFMLVTAVCEYGRLIMVRQLMDDAARQGARYAVVNTNSSSGVTTSQITTYVSNFLAGQAVNNLNVQVYQADPNTGANLGVWNAAPFASDIAVQIDLDFQPAVSLIIPSPIHMTTKSAMRSEAN